MEDKQMVSTVGGEQAGYLFEFRKDGVFFTVWPTADNSILFELSDMRQILKEYGVMDYDIQVLARTVREASGKPQKLADHFEASVVPQSDALPGDVAVTGTVPDERELAPLILDISKDRMTVTLHFNNKDDTRPPIMEEVLSVLQDKNIEFGIDRDEITRCIPTMQDCVVAKGVPAIPGEDAKIIRKFNLGEKGRPVKNKYDQVDYKNLNLFVLVKKGDLLAQRIPRTLGTPGKNVFGDEIAAKPGKPKPLPTGKNTIAEDENTLLAAIDGQIVDTGSKISVDPQLSISGDVGVSTGNINFTGGVHISGNVLAGFVVKATGDVEIKGMVSGATIEAGNVYISGGVQGMNRGQITARNDVRASFTENAEIEAGGNIYVSDVSLHSELRAGKMIAVEGKRGLVTGGFLAAGEEVRAKVIGNAMNVVTKVTVGVNPMLQRKYQETCREYAEAKKKLSQLTKALNTLDKIDMSKLPQNRIDQINAMNRSQFPLAGLIERDQKLIQQMEADMEAMKNGRVRVSDVIYPGVRLTINSVMKNIQIEAKHCTLYVKDDDIKTGAY